MNPSAPATSSGSTAIAIPASSLTIKQDLSFESISFRHIIVKDGVQAAQKILDDIRAASLEQCRKLEYMRNADPIVTAMQISPQGEEKAR
jgi:hypothetical protein